MNNQMNNYMNNQMNYQMNNQMNYQMNNYMNNYMNNFMNNQMNNYMNNFMNNQMNNYMNNQMNYQMNNQMNNYMNNQMNYQMNNQMNNNQNNISLNYHSQNNILTLNPTNSKNLNNPNIEANINDDNIKRNNPIIGAKLYPKNSDISSNINYYEYPEITFTDKEEGESKVILLIGQTGTGKTTFINAMINIYLGITIDDDFRYLMPKKKNIENNQREINENNSKNTVLSDTKEITVYNIRPKNGLNFPPLKIVDTPGFGDTVGREEDEKHFEKFKNSFIKKLITINCICYFVKSADCRLDDTQKYIFNCLMKLFDKNVNKNFMVGVTSFFPSQDDEKPNVINIFIRNDFYFKNILNSENKPREEILKSYWYFASDNYIISDNKIKRTEIQKLKWNYTENEIKKFIEYKIKKLQAVTVKESGEILNIRYELKVENEGLCWKISQLFREKELYEFNKNEINNCKNDLEEQELLIQRHTDKKREINEENLDYKAKLRKHLRKYFVPRKEPTDDLNTLCTICQNICHAHCECYFTDLSIWFCHNINFIGTCKICGHKKVSHLKEKFQYSQEEKIEVRDNNNSLELLNTYKNYEENNNYINMINNVEDSINIKISAIKNEKVNLENENKEYEEKILTIKVEIIKAFNRIKNNLAYLRINALKEEFLTLDEYIEKSFEKESSQKKEFFSELLRTYNKLIELNIDFPNLSNQQFKELKI